MKPKLKLSDFKLPKETTGLDRAFGGSRVLDELLPPFYLLPAQFQECRGPYCEFVEGWFFNGVDNPRVVLVPKPGIDMETALQHIGTCLQSFAPKHEHKIGGCGWLLAQWFNLQ